MGAFKVPPLILKEKIFALEPMLNEPPPTVTCPDVPPLTPPFNAALPVPETFSAPSSVVRCDTVKEPAEILRELPLLMVNAEMVSAMFVACVTA